MMESLSISVAARVICGEEVQTVNARELHAFLEVQTQFSIWITRRIEEYSFVEGREFYSVLIKTQGSGEGLVGRPIKEYMLTISAAKELAMVERSDKGKQARQYFIECERRLKTTPVLPEHLPNKDTTAAILLMGEFIKNVVGVKPAIAAAATLACIKANTGIVPEELRLALPPMEKEANNTCTPTQLGAKIGMSAVGMNKLLAGAGFQVRINDDWELTPEGCKWAEKFAYSNHGHSGYQIKWNPEVLDQIEK